mgnify:CR=1 FL=1
MNKMMVLVLVLFSGSVWAVPLDINKADAEAISNSLSNIGPKKAEAIVQYRKEHGDFKTIKDLENVKGIGNKTAMLIEKELVFTDTATVAGEKKPEKQEADKKVK